jgi:XRE family aerobic/anaerobic benzoate catabolism transcriptional regulator
MAQNREAMADLVAILDARRSDYARAQAELDTSGDTIERSFGKLQDLVKRWLDGGRNTARPSELRIETGAGGH